MIVTNTNQGNLGVDRWGGGHASCTPSTNGEMGPWRGVNDRLEVIGRINYHPLPEDTSPLLGGGGGGGGGLTYVMTLTSSWITMRSLVVIHWILNRHTFNTS